MASAEIIRLQEDIKEARETADGAKNDISTHEQLCSLRYEGIYKELKDIKKWGAAGLFVLAALMKSEKFADIVKLIGM